MTQPRERRRPRKPPRRARGRGLFVFAHALFAFALLLSQVARLSELVVVEHAICEHGALLHVGADRAELAAAEAKDEGAKLHASSSRPFEHEHCDGVAIVHRPQAIGLHLAPPCLLVFALPSMPPARAVPRPVALLFEAPKASPPALAA